MTPLTNEQKLAVAKMVPELVGIIPPHTDPINNSEIMFYKIGTHDELTDWEWFYVLHLAEDKLNDIQQRKYVGELHEITECYNQINAITIKYLIAHATDCQRATALMKIGGEE